MAHTSEMALQNNNSRARVFNGILNVNNMLYTSSSLTSHIGRVLKSVSHQVVATLLRQLDFCSLVNRNLFANHYLKVPMFLVAHFFPTACQKYFDEAQFSLAPRGGSPASL